MAAIDNYPLEVLMNPGHPYVYFNSLPPDIINKVSEYFSKNITDFTNNKTNTSSIEDAFSFLESVITVERAKENAFIEYLKNKTQDTIKLEIPDIDSNWEEFVREVQQTIDFGNTGIRDLKNEYERLKKNKINFEKAQEEGRKQVWYEKDSLTKTSEQLKKMVADFKECSYNANRLGTTILETIIERYKDSLLTIEGNKLSFNRTELAALIMSVTQLVLSVYNTADYDLSPNRNRHRVTKEGIKQALDDAGVDEQVQTLIKNFRTLPGLRKDIIQGYNLSTDTRGQKLSAKDFIDQSGQLINNTTQISMMIKNILSDYKFPEKAIRLLNTVNAMAEIESAVKMAAQGAFRSANTGGAGAKPDNIIAFLNIDTTAVEVFNKEQQNRIIKTAEGISNHIDDLVKSLAKTNTTEYYKEQATRWNSISKEIEQLLKQLEDIYGFLPSCFVIEDSTKNYLSLYTRMEDGELANAPHGGSLGARLDDQLNKIEALTSAGGISIIDKKWLTACIINAGPDMIAAEQKNKIENYLAMFAAILLFDGQINIAEEAGRYIAEQTLSASNTHQIHLFSVNNGYYPLSYVLKLTYDSLTKGLMRIQSETMSQGVQVDIYGFVNKPSPNSYQGLDSWEETSQLAQKSTKIKMKFLVQFQNIVSNLLNLE